MRGIVPVVHRLHEIAEQIARWDDEVQHVGGEREDGVPKRGRQERHDRCRGQQREGTRGSHSPRSGPMSRDGVEEAFAFGRGQCAQVIHQVSRSAPDGRFEAKAMVFTRVLPVQ